MKRSALALCLSLAAVLLAAVSPTVSLADPLICSAHSVSPAYFSPNGDKVQDTTTISYTLAQSARVKLTVVNSSSATVRTLVNGDRTASATAYRVVFNGRNQAGSALPNGVYRYVLVCSNSSGTQTLSGRLVIDRVAPVVTSLVRSPSSIWPNGDGFRDSVAARFTLSQMTLVGLRVTTLGGTTVRYTASSWFKTGPASRTWDGKNGSGVAQPYGYYRLILSFRDLAGNGNRKFLTVYVSPFSDIGGQSSTFRSAILGLVSHRVLAPRGDGWFTAKSDGTFGPYGGMRRGDLAVALVKTFGWQNESPGTVTFSDLPSSSPLYKYAAIAVRHGVMGYYSSSTKSFSPSTAISTMSAMIGMIKGMGLSNLAANIRAQDTNTRSYIGYSVLAGNLGFRYPYTSVFPTRVYNRREMAFSLNQKLHVPAWKIDRMKALFGPVAAQPIIQSAKQRAVTNAARQLVGYPYVWGGESFGEGGFDCSGFVYYVYSTQLGYRILRTAATAGGDSRYPRISSIAALKPADTVYFRSAGGSSINHTGLYLGNRYFIHSTRSRGGVSIDRFDSVNDSYWVEQFAWGRRIIPVVRLSGVRLSAYTIKRYGSPSSTRLYFTVSKPSRCTIRVYYGTTIVRTLLNSRQSAGAHSVVWNGRNTDGKVVAAGKYRISISVRDDEGNVKAAAVTVTVAN